MTNLEKCKADKLPKSKSNKEAINVKVGDFDVSFEKISDYNISEEKLKEYKIEVIEVQGELYVLKKDIDKLLKSEGKEEQKNKIEKENDKYNYYGGKDDPYEAIKIIKAWDLDFCLGNVIKYTLRAGKKDKNTVVEDLQKAIDYLNFEIEELTGKSVTRNIITNYDKYKDDILEKTANSIRFAFNKYTNKIDFCNDAKCVDCGFNGDTLGENCYGIILSWLLDEYEEDEESEEDEE